jgi:hypothetical protein
VVNCPLPDGFALIDAVNEFNYMLSEIEDLRYVYLAGFETKAEARDFAARFPKFVKAQYALLSVPAGKNTIKNYPFRWIRHHEHYGHVHCVMVETSRLTEVTGMGNEQGRKRLARFAQGISSWAEEAAK